jgi:hypothetical protein
MDVADNEALECVRLLESLREQGADGENAAAGVETLEVEGTLPREWDLASGSDRMHNIESEIEKCCGDDAEDACVHCYSYFLDVHDCGYNY